MHKVSICVATYNCSKILRNALDSIFSQRGVDYEVLIADANSSDGTREIIDSYKSKISWSVSEPDNGIYDAWNKMLCKVDGEWICFLGADDVFADENCLRNFVDMAENRTAGTRIVYARVNYVDKEGNTVFIDGKPWEQTKKLLETKMCLPHVGALHHRSIFDEGISFNGKYKISGDYALIRKETLSNGAYFINDIFVIAGMGGISTTPQNEYLHIVEEGRILKEQTGGKPLVWHFRYAKVLLRTAIFKVGGNRGLAAYERLKDFVF